MDKEDQRTKRGRRFFQFAASASIRPGHPGFQSVSDWHKAKMQNDPKFRKEAKLNSDRGIAFDVLQTLNGPDLHIDKQLRKFLREYNNRTFKSYGSEQPSSFNILQAFLEPQEKIFILGLLPEHFYQFVLTDFLDYATSTQRLVRLSDFEEFKIYEYNVLGRYSVIDLPNCNDIIFCGIAMIRDGSEINLIGLFGEKLNKDDRGDEIEIPQDTIPLERRGLFKSGKVSTERETLIEGLDYAPLILLARWDIEKNLTQARYILREKKDVFLTSTDDPTILDSAELSQQQREHLIENFNERFGKVSILFELMHSCLLLPTYFEKNEDEITIERHPTQVRLKRSENAIKRARNLLPDTAVNYREVQTIILGSDRRTTYPIKPSHLTFEKSGYWKTIPLGGEGTDKTGNIVHGKTWVEKKLSWYEGPQASTENPSELPISQEIDDTGYVYIMRSATHRKDVYKIGFTTKDPEIRANELSSATSQPDEYIVLISWKVANPRLIEQRIHQALAGARIRSEREFFKINFQKARECCEEIVNAHEIA